MGQFQFFFGFIIALTTVCMIPFVVYLTLDIAPSASLSIAPSEGPPTQQ